MLLTKDIEKSVIKTLRGYVSKHSSIKTVDMKRGFICPYHANYDVQICNVQYSNLESAYICDGWEAQKIAEKTGGEVFSLVEAEQILDTETNSSSQHSARQIEMLDVKFGDCFILTEGEHSMLVDFGTRNNTTYLTHAVSRVEKDTKITKALLTHFHEDHNKGFDILENNQKKQFNEIILPNIYDKSGSSIKLNLARLIVCSKRSKAWKAAFAHITLPIRMDKLLINGGHFIFVSDGGDFTLSNTTYNVLAPSRQDIDYFNKMPMLEIIEDIITNDDMLQKSYNEILIILRSRFEEVYKISEAEVEVVAVRKNQEFTTQAEYQLNMALEKFIARGMVLVDEFSEEKKEEVRKWNEKLSRKWNKLSIVFKSSENEILMTGDMEEITWRSHVKPKYFTAKNNNVKILKAPHHGTKSYFSSGFPVSGDTIFLISNGYWRNCPISDEYTKNYNGQFYCTNQSCTYYFNNGSCCKNLKQIGSIILPY